MGNDCRGCLPINTNIIPNPPRTELRKHGRTFLYQGKNLDGVDTRDGRWWRLWRDSDNDDNVEEGGSHPTPLTTATCELAVRLNSVGIQYASEASLSDVDDVNGRQRRRLAMDHPMMMKRWVMSANYGLVATVFFCN